MTEKLKQYAAFIVLTDELYEHCTLLEKMNVYVQHVPAAIVPFLVELINEVERLRYEAEGLSDEIDDNRNTIIELRETYND